MMIRPDPRLRAGPSLTEVCTHFVYAQPQFKIRVPPGQPDTVPLPYLYLYYFHHHHPYSTTNNQQLGILLAAPAPILDCLPPPSRLLPILRRFLRLCHGYRTSLLRLPFCHLHIAARKQLHPRLRGQPCGYALHCLASACSITRRNKEACIRLFVQHRRLRKPLG